MKMGNVVQGVRVLDKYTLRVTFTDGYVGTVDCSPLFELRDWSMVQKLRDVRLFRQVRVEHGVVTFPTGYDICSDVLRYYCERGRVCRQEDVDAAMSTHWDTVAMQPELQPA